MKRTLAALAAALPLTACNSDGTNKGILDRGASMMGNDSASRTNTAINVLSAMAKSSGYDFEPEAIAELRTQLVSADLPKTVAAYQEQGFNAAARQLVGSMIQNHLASADGDDKSIAPEAVKAAFSEVCPLEPFCD